MDIVITLLIMLLCLIVEGFFSGSEIAIVSADQMRLRHEAAKGSVGARLALKMLEKPEWLLSTTLIGTNISVVTNTTMATALMIHLFGEGGTWLAVLLVAPLIWVFGEIVPKSVFQQRADVITPYAIFILKAASFLFFPILIIFTSLTRLLTRMLGKQTRNPFTLREQIYTMMHMSAETGDINLVEQEMIRRMFHFSETTVEQIMVPLINVVAIEKNTTCGKAMKIAVNQAHKRLPVYDQRVDRIVGILYVLDLIGQKSKKPIDEFVKPVRYVPESKSIKELLFDLRQDGDAIAVVLDEFGGSEGIVSIEDIMEEVVEEIEDEYDIQLDSLQQIRKYGEGDYLVNGKVELDKLIEVLKITFVENQSATLAGYLLEHLREIPATGHKVEIKGIKYTIIKSTPQTIEEVRINW